MEALKIVNQLKDKTDSINLFGGFTHVTVRRGVWGSEENGATRALIDGILCNPVKLITKDSEMPKDGDKCKWILLDMPGDKFLSIATDARVFILGKNGQTIEAIY